MVVDPGPNPLPDPEPIDPEPITPEPIEPPQPNNPEPDGSFDPDDFGGDLNGNSGGNEEK